MSVLVCDVNETLLDLAPLREPLERHLGPGGTALWFARLVHHAAVVTLVDRHQPFHELGAHAFRATAIAVGGDPAGWDELAAAFGSLPAHPDVADALDRFRAAGWTVGALTNSAPESVDAGLRAAGIHDRFDRVLSVEEVGRFKPAPEPYRHACAALGVEPADAWMVACHDWDLAGAAAVGMRTAFLSRPGMPRSEAHQAPDLVVDDLEALAEALL